jgi:hypothetical protein
MANGPEIVRDLWYQGGNPLLLITLYITTRARDKALDLDRRTVYRKTHRGYEEVAVFKRIEDTTLAVQLHNRDVLEREHEQLQERIGNLIERIDSSTMGDPVI